MITRRHVRLVTALLLPLMVLRAMLPAGYMPVTENGELRMVMCSAGIQLPDSDDAAGGKSGNAPQDHFGTSDCPFAHAAVSAPPSQYVIALISTPREVRFVSVTADSLPPATGPPRSTAARAPPALS